MSTTSSLLPIVKSPNKQLRLNYLDRSVAMSQQIVCLKILGTWGSSNTLFSKSVPYDKYR
jgi:hypothetical protein